MVGNHVAAKFTAEDERTLLVDGVDKVPVFVGEVDAIVSALRAGDVHEDVDLRIAGQNVLDQRSDGPRLREIAVEVSNLNAIGAELFQNLLRHGAADEDQIGTGLCKALGNAETETAVCTGDDRIAAGNIKQIKLHGVIPP